jgi:hypothetical protein
MAEIPDWFPKDIEELYRPEPGEPASLQDPRVATSHGGGACPVQHWGVLIDGRVFYFRYRHGSARVTLGPSWYEPGLLPAPDPRTSHKEWEEAYESGGVLPNLWLGAVGGIIVTDADDGWFSSQKELDDAFRQCLDKVWDEPFDEEGWEMIRNNPPGPDPM